MIFVAAKIVRRIAAAVSTHEGVRRESGTDISSVAIGRTSLDFDTLYEAHFEFVWRSLVRLGVPAEHAEDAAQDVFVVVHRRLADFEGRSSARTWLYGITRRVAADHRKRARRRRAEPRAEVVIEGESPSPHQALERAEGARILDELLEQLDDTKREVFILTELEEMTAPEIAYALDVNVSTVYSRIAAARDAFNRAVARYRARQGGGR